LLGGLHQTIDFGREITIEFIIYKYHNIHTRKMLILTGCVGGEVEASKAPKILLYGERRRGGFFEFGELLDELVAEGF